MKKIILLLSATVFLVSCSKNKYVISGTVTGVEDGKTIILETQDAAGMGLIAVDTVKVEKGKFEIKGKAVEPALHTLQVEGLQGKVLFILENGDITVVINKDSLNKSKVSGTYNNDEFSSFTKDLEKIQKPLTDFQIKNTALMTAAQQNKDTVVINKLMAEFGKLRQTIGETSKNTYVKYAENHPKALISALIIQGMTGDPAVEISKIEKLYAGLDASLKKTKPGVAIDKKIKELKTAPAMPSAPAGPAGPATAN